MYAILHIPTGKLLVRPKYLDKNTVLPIDYNGITEFYSRKDAELYKRKFIIYSYLVLHVYSFQGSTVIFPKRRPRFLRKFNRFSPYSFAAFDLGNRHLDFYVTEATDGYIIAPSHKEFIVIRL